MMMMMSAQPAEEDPDGRMAGSLDGRMLDHSSLSRRDASDKDVPLSIELATGVRYDTIDCWFIRWLGQKPGVGGVGGVGVGSDRY